LPPELLLTDYCPSPTLVMEKHPVNRAKFPAIDAHNHLGRWVTKDGSWAVADVPDLLGNLE
jgi:hypothetical protein